MKDKVPASKVTCVQYTQARIISVLFPDPASGIRMTSQFTTRYICRSDSPVISLELSIATLPTADLEAFPRHVQQVHACHITRLALTFLPQRVSFLTL